MVDRFSRARHARTATSFAFADGGASSELLPYMTGVLAFVASVFIALPTSLTVIAVLNAFMAARTYVRNGRSILAPALVFSLVASAFGILGFLTTEGLVRLGYIPGYLDISDPAQRNDTLATFLLASLSVLIGASLARGRHGVRSIHLGDLTSLSSEFRNSRLALGFGVVTLAFNLAVRDIHLILDRDDYLIQTQVGGVLTYLQIPAAALLGLALRSSRWPSQFTSLLLVGLMEAFSFALSSRMMSLVAFMYFLGLALGFRRLRPVLLIVGAVIALLLVPVPLHMRGLHEQGLTPNLRALPDVTFFSADAYLTTFANVISSFNIVGLTTESSGIPWSAFLQSAGPLPGSLFDASVGSSLRLSAAIPFAGLGEVANHGQWLVPIVFILVGCVFALTESAASRLLSTGRYVYLSVAPTGVAFLAAVLFIQYNLRTAFRMVYLSLALAILMAILGAPKRRQVIARSAQERRSP